MKKIWIIMLVLGSVVSAQAQGKFFTRNGHISFFSHTDVEDIDARNDKVASVLDAETGQLEFAVLMKAFEFKKALMQEHFNENYVESDKYPKAQFKGRILNLEAVDFTKDGEYPVKVSGDLTIRDITKPINTDAKFVVKGGKPQGVTQFNIKPADYGIQIPSVVRENIAEDILVKVDMQYEPLNR